MGQQGELNTQCRQETAAETVGQAGGAGGRCRLTLRVGTKEIRWPVRCFKNTRRLEYELKDAKLDFTACPEHFLFEAEQKK